MQNLQSLTDLLELQNVDLDIDRLLEKRQSLPELERYRAVNDELDVAEAKLEKLEQVLRDTELAVDKADGEFQLLEQKVEQTERRLFAGGMSARETENMRLEVDQLRRQRSERETAVLEGLEERDGLLAQVADAREEAVRIAATKQQLEEAISQAWKEIDAELARRESRKAEIVPTIDPELLELYERLREHRGGVAVGSLEGGVCGGCHLRLSAAELKEALGSRPPRCTHCRRILVP
jgi:predicted  nucleic acid-binding Zn-ribbon protein